MKLKEKQIDRYSRQIILKKIGPNGQKKLLNSSVLIVGAGGLGSPIAIYLAALGIGKIGVIDKDKVEISNLSRQIIFNTDDINKKKSYEEILGKQHKKIATKNDIKNFFCFKFGFFLSNKKNAEINKVNDIKLCNKKEYIPDGLKKLIFVFSYIIPW